VVKNAPASNDIKSLMKSLIPPSIYRKNLILSQVVEERTVDLSVYSHEKDAPSSEISAKRLLAQAMIPGSHLVKVEIAQSTYDKFIQPVLVASEN
jgi:hypothetical protein